MSAHMQQILQCAPSGEYQAATPALGASRVYTGGQRALRPGLALHHQIL